MPEGWLYRGWPAILLWAVVFAGDYGLTVWGAKLYVTSGAKDILRFEGSYELTPYYQNDIDRGRWLSRRFVLALLASTVILIALWWLTVGLGLGPMLFAVGAGALLLREVPIYLRHFHNISFYRHVADLRVAPGSRVEYPRSLIYRLSAADVAVMATVWLVLAALLGSWFLLGGALGNAVVAVRHRLWARRPPAHGTANR
jgi:hypothetical protein